MLKGEVILCLSPSSWLSLWRNRQQIMSRLAKHNLVLFVEPQRNPGVSFLEDLRKNVGNLIQPRSQRMNEGLIVVSVPPAIPFGTAFLSESLRELVVPITVRLNNAVLARSIKSVLSALKIYSPILWLYSPFHLGLLGKFGEKLSCYHVYDEIAEYPWNQKIAGIIREYDEQMSRRVDFVFASSNAQTQRRKRFNPNTYFIPNGVDFQHFSRALAPELPIPGDIKGIPRPIIGFIGYLGFHIDLSLLDYVAQKHPDWSLVLIGPNALGSNLFHAKLKDKANVFFLGERELEALPGYLKVFDVVLLPYDKTTHTASSYPLKLHEYLAAGKPVVATAIAELYAFKDVVAIAQSPAEFVCLIEKAMSENPNAVQITRRVAVAHDNTWDQRVDEISRLIAAQLGMVTELHQHCRDSTCGSS